MNFQALERAVARLEKVLLFLRGATQEELAGQVKVYSEWLSSYQETGICLHPDRTAFNKFVEHVKQAEDCQRRNAIEKALAAAFEGMRDLASPELRAARCTPVADLPASPTVAEEKCSAEVAASGPKSSEQMREVHQALGHEMPDLSLALPDAIDREQGRL